MKNKHLFLVAMLLVCASSLFAQEFYRGDTIRILPSDKHYMTTEKMSSWVYETNHVILQVGGIRFTNGVLVEGIYSWVDPEDIELVAPCWTCRGVNEPQDDALVEQHRADSTAAAQLAEMDEMEAQAKDAREKAIADSIAAAELAAAQAAAEQVRLDSIAKAEEEYALAHRPVNRFTIGVRGGVASMMQDLGAVGKGKVGFDVALDLQYAHYWPTKKEHNVGLIVGVSAAFARNNAKGPELADYMLPTIDGDVNYHIEGSVNSLVMNEVQLEVPIMFSLITKGGFFLNVGPKLMVPVYSFYNQNLNASDITATFVKEGVSVTNDLVTGLFPAAQVDQKGQWHNAMIHVVGAGELGYEFKLKGGDSFGLGVYGSYSLFNNYKQLAQSVPSYVQITAPNATSTAVIDVKCASDVHANKLGYWDAGIKLAYHFNWPYKPHKK